MTKAVDDFLWACEQYGGQACAKLQAATSKFLDAARAQPELLTLAGRGLVELEPGPAAWLALTYGTAVETGFPPQLTAQQLLPAFDDWTARLLGDEDERAKPTPEQEELLAPFPYVCQAVVSHLARLPEEREARYRAERSSGRLEQLAALSYGAGWVREALYKSSGHLIVLHPGSGKGLELSYQNVSNCFHLFSLLQGAIGMRLPGGRAPDEATVRAARGDTDDAARDEAWWHYGSPYSSKPEIGASIWGESNPRELPCVEGQQALLLWKPLLGLRGWSSSFFRPQLSQFPPNASVERELSEDERRHWLRACRIES